MTLLARSLPHDRVGARSPFLNSCLRCEGGSDPTNFLGGWKPKKWGRSRPLWCFFHGDFRFHCVSISYASKKLLAPQGEELGEDEAEESNSYSLHLLRPDSRWPLRHNTSDLRLSCTLPLPTLKIAFEAHSRYATPTPLSKSLRKWTSSPV